MIGMHDLATVQILREGFDFLAKNPSHIEFLLCGFSEVSKFNTVFGPDYLSKAIKLIQEQAIIIDTYYTNDFAKRHEIVVVSSGSESQLFMGDDGYEQNLTPVEPKVLYIFKAKGIDKDELITSAAYKLDNKLWYNAVLTPDNGKTVYYFRGISTDTSDSRILLDREITEGTDLSNWKIQTIPNTRGYSVGQSIDSVNIVINIRTVGDISIHRIFSMCLRGIIKSRRLQFDSYGIQNMKVNYTPPVIFNEGDDYFGAESSYTLTAESSESWIMREYDRPNRIDINLEAVSVLNDWREPVLLIDNVE